MNLSLDRSESFILAERNLSVQAHESWQISTKLLLTFRWIACVYEILITLFSFYLNYPKLYTPIFYMTNWGNIMVALYFILILSCCYYYKGRSSEDPQTDKLWRFTKFSCHFAFAFEVLILVFFWSVLAKGTFERLEKVSEPSKSERILSSIALHAVTPVCIFVDVIFNMIQFQPSHGVVFVPTVAALYMLTNFIGTKVRGSPVYAPIDWETWNTVLFGLIALGLLALGYSLGHYLQKWKLRKLEEAQMDSFVVSYNDN